MLFILFCLFFTLQWEKVEEGVDDRTQISVIDYLLSSLVYSYLNVERASVSENKQSVSQSVYGVNLNVYVG